MAVGLAGLVGWRSDAGVKIGLAVPAGRSLDTLRLLPLVFR
jgi:hypothetical protein